MAQQLTEEEIYKRATKRVEEKRGFYVHLAVYIVVNAMLIVQWAIITGMNSYPWWIWTTFGWGIGIAFHGLSVFVFNKDTAGQAARVEREAERIRKAQGGPGGGQTPAG